LEIFPARSVRIVAQISSPSFSDNPHTEQIIFYLDLLEIFSRLVEQGKVFGGQVELVIPSLMTALTGLPNPVPPCKQAAYQVLC